MTETLDGTIPEGSRRTPRTVVLAALALAAVTAIGALLVFQFVASERERDLRAWQARMGIVADSRFAAVNDWIDRQFAQVRDLAQNASLQLYLTRLALPGDESAAAIDEPAERTYLRNLLVATAEIGRYAAPLRGPDIDANVERLGVAGIALLDNAGRVMVATPGTPPPSAELISLIAANRGRRLLYDLHLGPGGDPTMGFVAPVFALQSSGDASDQIGAVVGIKPVADELYPLLAQPGATTESGEAVLIRAVDEAIEYISPLADGTRPLRSSLARDTANLAAVFALDHAGGFAVRRDYADAEVLVLGRAFTTVPWTLMYKIETVEALAESEGRLGQMLAVLLLIIVAIAAALVATWRHSTSRQASAAAAEARELAQRFEAQHAFLCLVTDSQPNAMAIIDHEGRYLWVNRKLRDDAGLDRDEVVGKQLSAVVGPVPGKELLRTVREVLDSGESEVHTHSEERDGRSRTYQSNFIPLEPTRDMPARVLMASEDVTDILDERAKRERIMHQLVSTLVSVVDQRDPYSANHSHWVAKLARAMADEMELDPDDAECVEVAGRLMNLGKILVPEALLTKTTPLTNDELALIRHSLHSSADLIEDIEFTGPVVETLRQLHEYTDAGEAAFDADNEVLLTTRIIAVANTLVALVSPRAYRDGLSIDAALDSLLEKMSKGANRRVVLALANYLDNHGGREALVGIGKKSDAA